MWHKRQSFGLENSSLTWHTGKDLPPERFKLNILTLGIRQVVWYSEWDVQRRTVSIKEDVNIFLETFNSGD